MKTLATIIYWALKIFGCLACSVTLLALSYGLVVAAAVDLRQTLAAVGASFALLALVGFLIWLFEWAASRKDG